MQLAKANGSAQPNRLNVLIVEDSEDDYLLLLQHLKAQHWEPTSIRVESAQAMRQALEKGPPWEIVLCDHVMPQFDSFAALQLMKDLGKEDIPFVIVSGVMGEDVAVEAMRTGATDYILKSNLTRLPAVIRRDLAEAKEKEKCRQAQQELHRLQARDDFLSGVSHELRTPLTILKLQLQTFFRKFTHSSAQPPTVDQIRALLGSADLEVSQLVRIVEDILVVADERGNELSYIYEELDFCDLVRETITRMADILTRAGCTIELKADCKLMGLFDRYRIEQVLMNLISNSIKFAKGKPIHVRVQAMEHGATAQIQLSVRDFGPGIPEEKWQRIFEKFGSSGTGDTLGGIGLGLYVTRKIVEAHGGTIQVHESIAGVGTTFLCRFPLRAAQSEKTA